MLPVLLVLNVALHILWYSWLSFNTSAGAPINLNKEGNHSVHRCPHSTMSVSVVKTSSVTIDTPKVCRSRIQGYRRHPYLPYRVPRRLSPVRNYAKCVINCADSEVITSCALQYSWLPDVLRLKGSVCRFQSDYVLRVSPGVDCAPHRWSGPHRHHLCKRSGILLAQGHRYLPHQFGSSPSLRCCE